MTLAISSYRRLYRFGAIRIQKPGNAGSIRSLFKIYCDQHYTADARKNSGIIMIFAKARQQEKFGKVKVPPERSPQAARNHMKVDEDKHDRRLIIPCLSYRF